MHDSQFKLMKKFKISKTENLNEYDLKMLLFLLINYHFWILQKH